MIECAWIWPAIHFDSTTALRDPSVRPVEQSAETAGGKKLCCRACRNVITDEAQGVSIDGDHVHTRTNPAGITFRFGCFQRAPGCSEIGTASGEHTWFSGCRWRIAVCRGCGRHLGWSFQGAQSFFGLILGRLITESGRAT